MQRFLLGAILVIAVLLVFDSAAFAQCAMCRTALESADSASLVGGFRKGILLLLAAPYALLGTISFLVFRAYRQKRR